MATDPAPQSRNDLAVRVRAAGRLHLGFLDPAGTLGRRFGSVGLVIEGFETDVEIGPAAADEWFAGSAAARAELKRAEQFVQLLREHTGRREPIGLRLRDVLPAHAGFGSGTQLALAVGHAFARCWGIELGSATLAQWLGRGARSGIGIAGFDSGGLIVDGGPGADAAAQPIARIALPVAWRVIVVLDDRRRGLSGVAERTAISQLPPLPRSDAADLCHQVLMRVLPGAAGAEFATFAAGVNALQERLGAHFAPAQHGSAWTSPAVAHVMEWWRSAALEPAAIGQSSWGPTGFAVVESEASAQRLVDAAQAAGVVEPGLVLRVVAARNQGAGIACGSAGTQY